MNEERIIQFYRQGHSIKWITRQAVYAEKRCEVQNDKKTLQHWVEMTIIKYWKSI
jgi:hypothetical protein